MQNSRTRPQNYSQVSRRWQEALWSQTTLLLWLQSNSSWSQYSAGVNTLEMHRGWMDKHMLIEHVYNSQINGMLCPTFNVHRTWVCCVLVLVRQRSWRVSILVSVCAYTSCMCGASSVRPTSISLEHFIANICRASIFAGCRSTM